MDIRLIKARIDRRPFLMAALPPQRGGVGVQRVPARAMWEQTYCSRHRGRRHGRCSMTRAPSNTLWRTPRSAHIGLSVRSVLGYIISLYPPVSGHAGSSPARGLPPAPGDRRSGFCLPSWSGLCSRVNVLSRWRSWQSGWGVPADPVITAAHRPGRLLAPHRLAGRRRARRRASPETANAAAKHSPASPRRH